MRIPGRTFAIVGFLLLLLVIGTAVLVLSTQSTPDAPLLSSLALFPVAQRPTVALLGRGQAMLEAVDPLGEPNPGPMQKAVRKQLALMSSDADTEARNNFKVAPRGYEPSTELEVSAMRRTADAAAEANLTASDLIAVATTAQTQRLTAGYSIPGLVIRAAQPNYRGAITGRVVANPTPTAPRTQLRTAPLPAAAPLDPVYPLAVSACLGPAGLQASLQQVSQESGWTAPRRLEIAYALGCLFWWSREPDTAQLFSMLADEASGDPLLRLAALSGTVQGLNNFLLADDPYEKADILQFNSDWADAIESPWVDAAARAWASSRQDARSSVLIGRCPAFDGYIERIAHWVVHSEPGEQLMAEMFFAQPGFVGFLAYTRPDDWRRIVAAAPYANPEFNRLLFLAYDDEVLDQAQLGAESWPQMIRTALAMPLVDSVVLARVLGSSAAGDWQTVWPHLEAHILALPTRPDDTPWEDIWPFSNISSLPICPVPGDTEGDDPAFLDQVDSALARIWPDAAPPLRQAIVEWHLPRMLAVTPTLTRWKPRESELRNWLVRSANQEASQQVASSLAAAPPP